MSELHPTDDNLLDFVCKFLSDKEATELKTHLRSCPMCDEALLKVVRDRERLRASPPPRYVDGRYVDAQNPVRRFAGSRRSIAIAAGVAVAAAVVVLAVLAPRISAPPEDLYWMPIELTSNHFRDVSAPAVMVYQDVLDAYADRDAARSLVLLEGVNMEAEPLDGRAVVAQLVKASALLNTNESQRALAVLGPLKFKSLPAPWRGRAGWMQYLALRETGQSTAACSLLDWLVDEQGEIAEQVQLERNSAPCNAVTSAGPQSK